MPESVVRREEGDPDAAIAIRLESNSLSPERAGEPCAGQSRPRVRGKFLYVGEQKLYVRGVTYGPFAPDAAGCDYPSPAAVEEDFAGMVAAGINTVRTYTVPPRRVLDCALRHGLYVMVGLAWEQHIAFLDRNLRRTRSIEDRVRAGVRACAGHPAVLCYAVGNEIPSGIVRWHGQVAVERFIARLCRIAKTEDREALVTYVNYPTTEYLDLPFLDFVSFNVYLEKPDRLRAYLARLHNLAGDRPLVMAELGLDSRRWGEARQADLLQEEIGIAFGSGCAGTVVFSWTDEWFRGGQDIHDWCFGLTRRDRRGKPALAAVARAYIDVPFPRLLSWPRISVVVCVHNGARTLGDCLGGLERLDYPDYEVIVVDDGSTDDTAAIAQAHAVRVISTGANVGLSNARNLGLGVATGEIVAYIDDDAHPDPHWLQYLAWTFQNSAHAAVGGPNLPPPGDGPIADCVANAPGGPIHILLDDEEAEHIPGCNMAFRRTALEAVGGFDPRFRIAGDDVDLCWRLQESGLTLGFHPAAVVWHHRRNSVRAFWRQQLNYGRAEALLERKWPEKYNALGHLSWQGRVYGGPHAPRRVGRWRIYYGVWGSGLFQSVYQPAVSGLQAVALMPEWYLVAGALAVLSLFGAVWTPLLLALPVSLLAFCAPLTLAAVNAARASFPNPPVSSRESMRLRALTALLHVMQPQARLFGRLSYDLTPWRRRGLEGFKLPVPQTSRIWSEHWKGASEWLLSLEWTLRTAGARVRAGGDFDRWDLEVRDGSLGAVRILMAIEEHGAGRQLLRFRIWPHAPLLSVAITIVLLVLGGAALFDGIWSVGVPLALGGAFLTARTFQQCGSALATSLAAIGAVRARTGAMRIAQANGNGHPPERPGAIALEEMEVVKDPSSRAWRRLTNGVIAAAQRDRRAG